jgi:hypothetical protein
MCHVWWDAAASLPTSACLHAAGLLGSGQWAVGSSQSASPPVRQSASPSPLSRISLPPGTMHRLHRAIRSTAASPKDSSLACTPPGTPGTVAVQAKLLATSPLAACHGRSLDPRLGRIDSLLARTRSSSRSAVTAAHRLVPVEYRGPSARADARREI